MKHVFKPDPYTEAFDPSQLRQLAKSLVKTIGKDPSQHIFLSTNFGVQIKYQMTF